MLLNKINEFTEEEAERRAQREAAGGGWMPQELFWERFGSRGSQGSIGLPHTVSASCYGNDARDLQQKQRTRKEIRIQQKMNYSIFPSQEHINYIVYIGSVSHSSLRRWYRLCS